MAIYATGTIENPKRIASTLTISISNQSSTIANAQLEVYYVPTSDYSNAIVYFLQAFVLQPYNTPNSILTFNNIFANLDRFGVRVVTSGAGALNVAVLITALDAAGNRIFQIDPGELLEIV
jgi:hypothetical protein